MVLSTGNKSENAVGYCTLYGDMAGGLAVISDVPKMMVYELARYINREREVIPRSTIEKPPSAELRPDQKDTDSLPPYEILDVILKAYIEDVQSPEEIAAEHNFDEKMVHEIVLKVDRNEYKRKQAAPGLKITSRAFGFGRPFPIAQNLFPNLKTRLRVKLTLKLATFAFTLFAATTLSAQQPAATPAPAQAPSAIQKSVEAFLRNFYALGPDIQITVGTPKEFGTSGIIETPVDVKTPEGTEKVKMYLSKDGRYLMRGEVTDLTTDPLAETRAKIITANAPVLGNPNATITLVEYSDFECPVCRILHDGLRGLLPNYPQVKVIFKDYPIETLHPWARTAALAGRCAYMQDPKAFWKVYDLIYDNQELISAANSYDKFIDFAGQAGLNQGHLQVLPQQP